MIIDILTLFPNIIEAYIHESILGKAIESGKVEVNVINFRDYSNNKHNKVDDYPFGGGYGMLLSVQPIYDCLESIPKTKETKVILTSPQGKTFNQKTAEILSKENHLVFICGHYEGFDERIGEHLIDEELSLGDFVLTGGELAALTMVDAITRLIPEVLTKESHENDSFSTHLLEYPQYTRPREYKGMKVPDVLLSGNHLLIERYRMKESLRRTFIRRPDLLENYSLSPEEKALLDEVKIEEDKKNVDNS